METRKPSSPSALHLATDRWSSGADLSVKREGGFITAGSFPNRNNFYPKNLQNQTNSHKFHLNSLFVTGLPHFLDTLSDGSFFHQYFTKV